MTEHHKNTSDWAIGHGMTPGDFEIVRPVRSSHKWTAYLAKDKTGKRVTLTYIDKDKILERVRVAAYQQGTPPHELERKAVEYLHEYQRGLREMTERVKGLVHENVAEVFGCSHDREKDQLVIVAEYTPGVDLFYACGKLNPTQSIFLYAQVIEGLSFIHASELLHLNIKPSRICVDFEADTPTAKFTDFGFAIPLHGYTGAYNGTSFYMAPEVILEQRETIDERADLFSLGITMYYCLTGRQPLGERFVAQSNKEKLVDIVRREKSVSTPPSHFNKAVPPELDRLVMGLIEKDPETRAFRTARDVLNMIYEQWPEESRKMVRETTSTLLSYD